MVLLACACQHSTTPSNLNLRMPPIVPPSPTMPKFQWPSRKPVDPRRLEVAEFLPPGARRVGPNNPRPAALAPENRTRFPSTALATSPDGNCILFHDGAQRSSLILHWLRLLKRGAAAPNDIFCTAAAFDTTWSGDSQRFAVTLFTGQNSSEVFTEQIEELRRTPVALRPLIEEYFPLNVMSAPMFVRAYRWTQDGKLIVRALGRAEEAPFEEFGCEALVSFPGPGLEPRLEFLQGYLLPETSEDAPR